MADTDTLKAAPNVPLRDVEWRVDGKPFQRNGQDYSRFVPYVDAATTAALLDEWVGPANWQDDYEADTLNKSDVLWCRLSVRNGSEWVTKRDVGKASNFEGEKGMVSDAFKRAACLKWGVARNVYTLPTLTAPCRTYEANGKTHAAPNDKTIPSILKQLRDAGYDADGAKVQTQDTNQGAGDDGAPAKADAGHEAGDGADGQAVGRDAPEPAPAELSGVQKAARDAVNGLDAGLMDDLKGRWPEGLPKRFGEMTDEQAKQVLDLIDEISGTPF